MSILFNAAATTALRTLQATNTSLDETQKHVASGLKIGEAKDNAAYWSISTSLKSDNAAMSTVKDALGLGAATVDTAYQGLNSSIDVLNKIKSKLTSATQAGVDRQAVQDEINALQDQLRSIATSSTFSGENWLSVNSGVYGYDATKSVVASFSRDANDSVSIGKINIDTSSIALYDANAATGGILDGQVQMLNADGTTLSVGGTHASGAAPALQGLDTATGTNGVATASPSAAVANLGTFNIAGLDTGDRLTFNLAVDGGPATFVQVDLSTVTNAATFQSALQTGITNAFGSAVATVAVDGTTGAITLTSANAGGTSAINVTSVATVDGDGVATDALGLSNGATAVFGSGTVATTTVAFSGTSDAGDTLDFRFQYNGDVYQAAQITMTASMTESQFATALQTAIDSATKISDGTTLGTGKVVASGVDSSGTVTLKTAQAGEDQNFSIVQVTTADVDADGTTGANANLGLAVTTTASGTSAGATYDLGVFDATNYDAGDRVSFDVTVYTDNSGSPLANQKSLDVAASNTIGGFTTNLQAAFNAAYGAGVVTVTNDGTNISVTTVAKGPNSGLAFDNLAGVDGNGTATSALGLANGAAAGSPSATAAAAYATAGSAFSGSMTFDLQDSLSFNVAVDGGAAKTVTVTKATVDAALSSTDGVIADANDFATVLNQALSDAGVTGLTASNDSGTIKIAKNAAGAGSVAISNVASTTGSDTISVDQIDITSADFKALSGAQQSDVLSAYISVVNQALTKVTAAASSLGAVSSRIDLQSTFVTNLMDTIDKGVSGLVDADMNEESTRLQALQVQQQLGVQALSIANQSAQNVLRLFQ